MAAQPTVRIKQLKVPNLGFLQTEVPSDSNYDPTPPSVSATSVEGQYTTTMSTHQPTVRGTKKQLMLTTFLKGRAKVLTAAVAIG